jgi:Carboxypeptidase regulatory-like domain/TonB dependent receptor
MQAAHKEHEMTQILNRDPIHADTSGVPPRSPGMLRKSLLLFLGLWLITALTVSLSAQSITSGDVTGTVTDPTGASVPGATVTLTNLSTNSSQKTTSGGAGDFRFAFINPGTYKLDVKASGFQTQEHPGVSVLAGQPTTINFQLTVAGASQSVDVVEAASALQTENADVATGISTEMIDNLPNPGGDLTYLAQTAPGVVMNTQSGYGNFSSSGMPGISNLFTINGMNFNDPFLSLNNSGASNLMLGANDIAEANVINNAYSGQYGQYAGAQVTYISRSGTNQWHGDATYNWNGREMNSNQFFLNQSGLPTPFNNFNQWAAGVNGPIWKNRTFFDVDYEGVRSFQPSSAVLNLIPSPQFQAATLQNLMAKGNSAEIPFYQQAFAIYNSATGATPVAGGGCGSFTSSLLGSAPCEDSFRTAPTSLLKEYQWAARVDHIFSDKDRGYVRVFRDNGFQPTYTSAFGSAFNASSNQPQMAGQVSETHTFGPTAVNQLSGSVLYYAAIFNPSNPSAALAALPTVLNFTDGSFTPVGAWDESTNANSFFPNGRRVFQYQLLDDFSLIKGKHTIRLGFSWLHQTVSDLDFESLAGLLHGEVNTNINDFYNGGGPASYLLQGFPSSPEAGIRFNTRAGYIADDWKATDRLTISLNLRFENYANPTCDQDCFTRLATPASLAPDPSAASTPYNQLILFGQHSPYANTKTIVTEPRIGIAWRPFNNDKTVIRTGGGIFADNLPGGLAENSAFNPPQTLTAVVPAPLALAPGVANSPFTAAANENQALLTGFKTGGSFNSLSAAVPGFNPPAFYSFPNTFMQPTYYKWNFEVEESLGAKMLLTVNYQGMHGVHLPLADFGINAYCPPGAPGSPCPNGFAGLPAAPPNPAFGLIQQYTNAGIANYNGLTISLQRRLTAGLTFNINYTWSHDLDAVSNGGIANEYYSANATNLSVTSPQIPSNLLSNYGNSDYDVRHYFSANMVLSDMFRHTGFKWGPNSVFGGWTLSSNWFLRSGLPYSVVDGAASGALYSYNYNATIFATPLGYIPTSCTNGVNSPCINTSQFAPSFAQTGSISGFGSMGRNQLYGPHFFNVDLALMKSIRIKERLSFSFGASASNLFNHPNFDNPYGNISNPGIFGSVISTVSPPTSILGAFLGAGGSPRFVEIKGVLRF